jgi:hypothetical protein
MQLRDRLPIRDIENDPDHRRLRAKVQAKHMVIGASAAEEACPLPALPRARGRIGWGPRDRLQIPHGFVKTRRLVEIAGDKFDATHAANEAGRHVVHAITAWVMLSRSDDLACW